MTTAPHPSDDLLAGYGLGTLDDGRAATVHDHLESCADCRRRVAATPADSFVGRMRAAANPDGLNVFVDRVVEAWRPLPGFRFTLSATTLLTPTGAPCLHADAHRGRWLLPAFMAGVYSIGVGVDGALALGLQSLAVELAALRLETPSLERFASWVWGEGAEGLELGLGFGVLEVGSVREASDQKSQSDRLRAVRTAPLVGDNDVVIAGDDLDRAAVREELAAPLALYAQGAAAAAFELAESERRGLGRDTGDAAAWLNVELAVALDGPAFLRERFPAGRIVGAVLARLGSTDVDVVGLVDGVLALRERHAAVWQGLVERGFGAQVARALPLTAQKTLSTLLTDDALAEDVACALLARVIDDASAEALGRACGLRPLVKALSDADEAAARALVRVTVAVEPARLVAVLDGLPLKVRRAALRAVPLAHGDDVAALVAVAIDEGAVDHELVALACVAGDGRHLARLARRLHLRRGGEWSAVSLRLIARTLAEDAVGAAAVAAVANHLFTGQAVKVSLLDALRASPHESARARAAKACLRRFELFEVRERCRRLLVAP